MPDLPFAKGQALGNDYLVLDAADLPWRLTPSRIRALCDRHRGIGSDGILLGVIGAGRFRLRIFNPDGSEAEKSGNGLRIFGAYLHGHGLVGSEAFVVELPEDAVTMRVIRQEGDGSLEIRAAMGQPSFRAEAIGFRPGVGEVAGATLELGDGAVAEVHPVSMGNPHCVVRVADLDHADFMSRAPRLSSHDAFAAGTNVQFVRVTGPESVRAWIFERGAGETMASGSSACAVAAVARRQGWITGRRVLVEMDGGTALVEVDNDGVLQLQGPAQIIYRGVIRGEVLAAR
jgi:diaminopimelate epimerase